MSNWATRPTRLSIDQETQTDAFPDDDVLVKRPVIDIVPEEQSECKPCENVQCGEQKDKPKERKKPPSYLSDCDNETRFEDND